MAIELTLAHIIKSYLHILILYGLFDGNLKIILSKLKNTKIQKNIIY